MFKKVYLPLLCMVVFLSLLLTGCGCKHEWKDATCDAPTICIKCDLTEGEALGHKWKEATCETSKICERCKKIGANALRHQWADATCETPKTCSVCQKTDGEALGHEWADATCETPRTCSVCNKKEGEAQGHTWIPATTDAPKTCSVCNKTEGERLLDPRFNKEACQELIGIWGGTIILKGEETGIEGFNGRLELSYTLTFRSDGSYQEIVSMLNESSFKSSLANDLYLALYFEFTLNQGMSGAEAEAAMKAVYGMTMREYANAVAYSTDWKSIFNTIVNGVYYVADGLLYSSESWSGDFGSDAYSVKEKILTIQGLKEQFPSLTITRAY